jgi:hypothetical protein
MTRRDPAPDGTPAEQIREIRAILDERPELLQTLPPAERALAEAVLE